MKKTVKILLFTAMLCICAAGTVACGNRNDDSSSISSSGTGETKAFRVLSDLEFYNWDDAKDIVIGYENAEVSDVKIEGSSLSASDYTAENGKLTISRNKLDSYSEGKYELKVSSGTASDTVVLFVGNQIQDGSRYVRRQTAAGKDVAFYFAAGEGSLSLTCNGTAVPSDSYAYDSEEYKLTVKSGFLDGFEAGIQKFTVTSGNASDSFEVLTYGGKGYAASAVMGAGYKDVGFESVSLPLELFAADAVYDVSEEGLVFSEKDFLASSVELASDTVYCLKFTIKTSATYMTVTLGNTEIVTFDGEGILSSCDERTTWDKTDGWQSVCAYFYGGDGELCLRKGAADSSAVTLSEYLLLETKIVDVSEEINLGTGVYKKATNRDVNITLPFNGKIISSLKLGDTVIGTENYFIENETGLVVSGEYLEENLQIDEQKDITVEYVIVLDEKGTVSSDYGKATLALKCEKMDAPVGMANVAWEDGKDVSVKVDPQGGEIVSVKLNESLLPESAYTFADGELRIDKANFSALNGIVAKIEIFNQGGSFVAWAQKGELVLCADAETGEFESDYNFNAAPTNSAIVSGSNALDGSYSYQRSGPNDTWNTFFETFGSDNLFVLNDYYLITFRIKPNRSRADSDLTYNEIRTYFDIGTSLSEITHLGIVKKDDNARENGKASVWKIEDGSLDIAVTLPAKSQVLSIAFCFEGSAIFDNICVYHLASAQEEETPSADRTATQTIPEAIVETKPAVLSDERKENIL